MASPQGREVDPRWVYLTGALLLTALPFASVDIAPGVDLPQHAAQARLLRELWGLAPATVDLSSFVARPFGANTLCYWPLLLLTLIAPPQLAVKLCLLGWLAAAVIAFHLFARRRNRPAAHALAGGVLLFGLPLYWGLLNFVSGLAVFVLFTERVLRPGERSSRALAIDAVLLLLLYFAHVLWVAAAGVLAFALAARSFAADRDARGLLRRAAVFVPVALATAPWLLDLLDRRAATGVRLEAQYLTPFVERASPGWLATSLFGGIRGPFEPLMAAGLGAYAALALLAPRRSRQHEIDRALIAIGLGALAFTLLAPDQYLNTIVFNDRFLGYGAMFLLLGLPSPGGRRLPIFAGLLALVFALGTTTVWIVFDQAELTGLRPSLAAIERPQRVLGLDYRRESQLLRDRPFMQLFAYTQAAHGGELSFSFTEHRSSIVSYREPPQRSWAPGLEWSPERATERDVAAFDCVIVNGTDEQHRAFAERFRRTSALGEGYFRPYCQK